MSEHSETLVELDIEYKKLAQQNGCDKYTRIPALGINDTFIESLFNLVINKNENLRNNFLNNIIKNLNEEFPMVGNKKKVEENLIDLVSKIGEKITIRKSACFVNDKLLNFSYTHASIKKNIGKIGVLLSIETKKDKNDVMNLGKQLAMQIASSPPLAIDKEGLDLNILKKEKEIITEELKNSGKDTKIVEKIALGKLNKFIGENTLLNQEWIMEPKKKVKDVIREFAGKEKFIVKDFLRFKVGEGL